MSDETSRLEFTLERSMEAKSRPTPILVREDDKHTVGSFADPTEALGEAYIRARARAAKRAWEKEHGREWPMNARYGVHISLGATVSGENTDLDNLEKTILDGMSKALFDSDNRVALLHAERDKAPPFTMPAMGIVADLQPRPGSTRVTIEVID